VTGARELAQRAIDAGGGRVDILVNNAGIFPFGTTTELSDADYAAVFAVNVAAPFALVQALAPGMAERGGGAIVNVSSGVAQRGWPLAGAYSATKAALDQFSRSWAAEFGPAGVRVNTVSPGPVRTEGTAAFAEMLDDLALGLPSKRVSRADEIAAAIGFLAGPGASNIHGAVLAVDGGYLAA
jgi:NAD(P)-dependent dehydrogenase (short-subunit alcohol dehydrogenase family)